MATQATSLSQRVWAPLPWRDGNRTSSTSAPSVPSALKSPRLSIKKQRADCSASTKPELQSPRTTLLRMLMRGIASLLQLLPQLLHRMLFQHSMPYLIMSAAASALCFLSLNIPGTYVMLCSVLGMVAFTILTVTAYTHAAMKTPTAMAATAPLTTDAVTPLLPPQSSYSSPATLRRHNSAGQLSAVSGHSGADQAGSHAAPVPSLRQRRPVRRQPTASRMPLLETVHETQAAIHPLPTTSSYHLLRTTSTPMPLPASHHLPEGCVMGRVCLPALVSADGIPVTDIELAACVSNRGSGLDLSFLPAADHYAGLRSPHFGASAVGGNSDEEDGVGGGDGHSGGTGAVGSILTLNGSSLRRVDSAGSGLGAAAAVDAGQPKTMFGRAYEIGERMWPWVTVPVAVACLPVAVACTLPVAVPLLCTYGAVRLGTAVVRAGAAAVCDYMPGAGGPGPLPPPLSYDQ